MRFRGSPAAPGVALGPAWIWRPAGQLPTDGAPVMSLDEATHAAVAQLDAIAERLRGLGRADEAAILEAQSLMALDPMLLQGAREEIEAGRPPSDAIRDASERVAATLEAIEDPVLAARAADIRDVGSRIARVMAGHRLALPERPSIAICEDLPPSVTAEIPEGLLLGVALVGGSATSHAAILARSLGIPAVVGVDGLTRLLAAGQGPVAATAALDGGTGDLVIDPADDEVDWWAERSAQAESSPRPMKTGPVATLDGRPIAILANIGRPEEARAALDAGADGVGLFRSEFLFLGRLRPPTEDEQVVAYRDVLERFGRHRPVVIRLADIGGDKDVPYLGLPAEDNPFLGVRAVRLAVDSPDLLVVQVRAIMRAATAAGVTANVMAPMVATLEDVDLLEAIVGQARRELPAGADARLRLGVMIEVPSAVLLIRELAARVAFVS
ncbi:MAG TPA: putative PEP-binding protein, partial [Candidatus Limnocylindrales bacterium]